MAKQPPRSISTDHSQASLPALLPPPPVPGEPPVRVPIMLAAAWQEAHGLILVDSKPAGRPFPTALVVVPKEAPSGE